jgi:hypothetical protein
MTFPAPNHYLFMASFTFILFYYININMSIFSSGMIVWIRWYNIEDHSSTSTLIEPKDPSRYKGMAAPKENTKHLKREKSK